MKVKFISPVDIYIRTKYDDDSYELSGGYEKYLPVIKKAVEDSFCDDPDFAEKGLVAYTNKPLINKYVKSALVSVDILENSDDVFAICTCEVDDAIERVFFLPQMLTELRKTIVGQYSDGWGESFEQKAIIHDDYGDKTEIYVSFGSGARNKMSIQLTRTRKVN